MMGRAGMSSLDIDLTRMHRRTVTSFYSNLVTRPTGRAVRMGVESQLAELDAGRGALAPEEPDDAREGSNLLVVPEPEIAVGDAALRHDAGRLDDHQPEAAHREAPEMDEVPVVGEPVARRVLTHG